LRRIVAALSTLSLTERALNKNDWPLSSHGPLTLTLSPLLKSVSTLTHAFTTRLGGQSQEPLNWFNLGRHIDDADQRADASANRKILCRELALDPDRLTVPGQKHTTNVFILEAGCDTKALLPDFDAVATVEAEHPVLLHFADCTPVIAYDHKQKVLCVMHAGWRGTAGGIVKRGIKTMAQKFGSRPGDVVAAVGPTIGSCCYETGVDVAEKLSRSVTSSHGLIATQNGKAYPDLKAINTMQLLEAGVQEIDTTSWCTACHADLFYSHRQSGGKTGRQGAIACITG
jgi:YfiH family protein